MIDPLNHFRTDPDKVAVPYYSPHPITERLALTVFPQARPLVLAPPPQGVRTTLLAASSQDSYRRPAAAGGAALASAEQATPLTPKTAAPRRSRSRSKACGLGAATEKQFRLVVAGTSKFASNEYFPYVSNGELSVSMLRWLAADETTPSVKPQTYQLPEIVLTSRQMRDVFLALGGAAAALHDAVRRLGVVEAAVNTEPRQRVAEIAACGAARRSAAHRPARGDHHQRRLARRCTRWFASPARAWSPGGPSDVTAGRDPRWAGQRRLSPRRGWMDHRRHDRGGAGRACVAYRHRLAVSACQRASARDRADGADAGQLCRNSASIRRRAW